MSKVLVDSSVWIEMFKNANSPVSKHLGTLLKEDLICSHGLILAEILSGAKTKTQYRLLREYFSAISLIKDPPDLWDGVAWARYRLARRGFQAGIADLVVALAALHHGKTLFTLDKAFGKIKTVLPLEILTL